MARFMNKVMKGSSLCQNLGQRYRYHKNCLIQLDHSNLKNLTLKITMLLAVVTGQLKITMLLALVSGQLKITMLLAL